MLNAVGKYGFWLFVNTLLIFPVVGFGQDLGSTTGIFRSPNPASKKNTPAKKEVAAKNTSAKKPAPPATKSAAPKNTAKNRPAKSVSKPKPEAAAFAAAAAAATAKKTTPKTQNTAPVKSVAKPLAPENIVITVGKSTTAGVEEPFEKAIDEGNYARDERNYVRAETSYRRALNLKPQDSRGIYGLGNIYSDQQRWEEAENAYRQAINLDPDSPEAYIALSFVLTQPLAGTNLSERYAEAEKMARKAIDLDATNPIAYDQLGTALELSGRIGGETQNAYRRAIELDPNFALAYAHLGRLLRRKGSTQQSSVAYQNAVRLSTDVPTMILVADVMQSQQRYEESEQLLVNALREDSKNPSALFLLGRALTTRGAFDEAEKLLKKSVEVSPNSFVSYALLSSLYARRGIYDEAEKVLMRAMRVISPNEKKRLAAEFEFVGDGLMRVGKNKDAARVYRHAVALDGEKNDLAEKLNRAEKT